MTRLSLFVLAGPLLLPTIACATFILPSHEYMGISRRHNEAIRRLFVTKKNGLWEAGELLAAAADADENMREAGLALCRAGQAWTEDWPQVTEALYSASKNFNKMARDTRHSAAEGLISELVSELEDASSIEGCTSVGPSSSIPNLIEIQRIFTAIGQLEMASRTSATFLEAADAVEYHIDTI